MFWYDILIIVIVAAAFLYGFMKGIISELFALAAFILGIVIAMKFSFLVQPYILCFIKGNTAASIISFVVLFLLTAIIIIILGIFFKKAIKLSHLSWLDRIIGGIFGIVKGTIIAGVISLLIFTFAPGGKSFIKKSTFGRYTISTARIAVYLFPKNIQQKLKKDTKGKVKENVRERSLYG